MSVLLSVQGLTQQFGAIRALGGVDLAVEEGSIMGVIGPNGAGKSTLFNAVAGFRRPTSGRVVFDGHDITGWPADAVARRGIGRTFQATRPLEDLNLRDNVMIGAHTRGRSGLAGAVLRSRAAREEERAAAAAAAELLTRVGLGTRTETRPDELTAGRRRLLEIARVLAMCPRLLLLDEPAAGLTRAETVALEEQVRRVREDGVTIVLVEHDVDLVLRLCDDVTVLDFGQVIACGPPDVVRHNDAVVTAYLGGPPEEGA